MTFSSKYGLGSMKVGETKTFEGLTPTDHTRIKRSAHNYNSRSEVQFMTRFRDGALHVTRLK